MYSIEQNLPHQDYVDLWVDHSDYILMRSLTSGDDENPGLFWGMVRNDFVNNRSYSPAEFGRMVSWVEDDKAQMYEQFQEIPA